MNQASRPGAWYTASAAGRRELAYLRGSRWDLFLLFGLPLLAMAAVAALFAASSLRRIPAQLLDLDHSALSRSIERELRASPALQLLPDAADRPQAEAALRSARTLVLIVLPQGLERSVVRQQPSPIQLAFNASYQTAASQAMRGAQDAVQSATSAFLAGLRGIGGLGQLHVSRPTVQVKMAGNAQTSFERFLEPLVLCGILHLLLSCACVAAAGRELKQSSLAGWVAAQRGRMLSALLGKLAPYVLIYLGWFALVWLWLGAVRGWPIAGHLGLLLLAQALLCTATAAIAALLVAATMDVDAAFSVSTIYAGSALAFSGGTLPLLHTHGFARYWSTCLPFSHYLRVQTQQFTEGSAWQVALPDLLVLLGMSVLPWLLAGLLLGRRGGSSHQEKPRPCGVAPDERRCWPAFAATWLSLARDRSVLSLLVLSVLLYGFYYPAAYTSQVSVKLPMAVVDLDHSSASRALIRGLDATRAIEVASMPASVAEANAMLRDERVDGVLVLPAQLLPDLLYGRGGGISISLSAGYLVRMRDIGESVNAVIEGLLAEHAERYGSLLRGVQSAPPLQSIPMYNRANAYGPYVVPAVAAVILQQTLLFGTAMLVALRREQSPRWRMQPGGWLGSWLALTVLGCLTSLFYFGFVFWFQDYPRAGNLPGLLCTVPWFAAAVAGLGLGLGSLFRRSDRPVQILAGTSVLLFFLGGVAWPLFAMPAPLAWLAHLSPATAAMQAFVKLNGGGATLGEILPEYLWLVALTVIYGGWSAWRLIERGPAALRRPAAALAAG